MTYRIIEHRYYNDFGKSDHGYYTIQKQISIFGIKIWKNVMNPYCDPDMIPSEQAFGTLDSAVSYIENVLKKDIVRLKWVKTIIKEI